MVAPGRPFDKGRFLPENCCKHACGPRSPWDIAAMDLAGLSADFTAFLGRFPSQAGRIVTEAAFSLPLHSPFSSVFHSLITAGEKTGNCSLRPREELVFFRRLSPGAGRPFRLLRSFPVTRRLFPRQPPSPGRSCRRVPGSWMEAAPGASFRRTAEVPAGRVSCRPAPPWPR